MPAHRPIPELVLIPLLVVASSFLPGLRGTALAQVATARDVPAQEARFREARARWEEGRFVEALEELEQLLVEGVESPLQDRIALLTGELYPVSEIASDGRAVRWSPDGRFAAYESTEDGRTLTHVVAVEAAQGPEGRAAVTEVARFEGSGAVFGPGGAEASSMAYLRVPDSEELRAQRDAIEARIPGNDRSARMLRRQALARLEAEHREVVIAAVPSGRERVLRPRGVAVESLLFDGDGSLHAVGRVAGEGGAGEPVAAATDVFRLGPDGSARKVTTGPGVKTDPFFAGNDAFLVYGTGREGFAVQDFGTGEVRNFEGSAPALSSDGRRLAFLVASPDGGAEVQVLTLEAPLGNPVSLGAVPYPVSASTSRPCSGCPAQSGLALSADGSRAVVQARPRDDWELFLVEGGEAQRVTREIQHDLFPAFLAGGRLLAVKGEARHRRAYLYDLEGGRPPQWLFRNNTVRTVSPEYEWAPSPDGSLLLIVAERDGNTVSPERGVYLLDLARRVPGEELLARVRSQLGAERALRAQAEAQFGPIREQVKAVVDQISVSRIFEYERDLYAFGSKHISQPGNAPAIEYLVGRLREFGYDPELQWFEPRGTRTANVVVRLPGTVSPEVVYAVSAHFDSNTRSPGADDNTSGTVGLLEMARVLAGRPLPATVEIAFFTGEEAGLLGSREYVRRAVEEGKRIVGALNNDMVGFAEDHRLDNTIRYSNRGIRDLQHGAAILFSRMVTHDAEYYKSTDAAAYYDAFGDIVGGIGSYPILASPHYHQTHDILETVNHELVTEVAKVTTASAMLMASSPSRLAGVVAERIGERVEVRWAPAPERDVTAYRVAYGPASDPRRTVVTVRETRAVLEGVPPGATIAVKAVNERGLEGWDWAVAAWGGG